MNDKFIRLFLVLLVGWAIGYAHHYFATAAQVAQMEDEVASLEGKVRKLYGDANTVRKVYVKTTAYSNDMFSINKRAWRDKRTATNKPVKRGIVAADWRIFPPGTLLYIPGYGEAVVEDRGGGVKGYHLDLFVDTYGEALEWGVQDMDVYVIEKGALT